MTDDRLFFYYLMFSVMTGTFSKLANPLSGQHLRVLAQEVPFNLINSFYCQSQSSEIISFIRFNPMAVSGCI